MENIIDRGAKNIKQWKENFIKYSYWYQANLPGEAAGETKKKEIKKERKKERKKLFVKDFLAN